MAPWISRLIALSVSFNSVIPSDLAQKVSFTNISKVRTNMLEIASASWEVGTVAEALLELSSPSLSVFNATAFPPPRLKGTSIPTDVLDIANRIISAKPTDSLALVANQGSAADPASIGVTVLLANWTRTNLSDLIYAKAAADQLTYLLKYAPRSESGAISHRTDEVQLWADFIYMVPPFIAYYGALQGGNEGHILLQTAYDQCRLYRDALRDDSGLWRHIALGSFEDKSHWATGNAWAAAGMLRVLSTLNHTSDARQFASHQTNLTSWIDEILEATWPHQNANGTLLNVVDDQTSFADSAATALFASVTYRMAVFKNNTSFIGSANRALNLIKRSVDADGWLQNVVDPLTFHRPLLEGEHSPEGQAFVILLEAAWQTFITSSTKFML